MVQVDKFDVGDPMPEVVRSVPYSHIKGDVLVPNVVMWGGVLKVFYRCGDYGVLIRDGYYSSSGGKGFYDSVRYMLVRFTQDNLGLCFEVIQDVRPGRKWRSARTLLVVAATRLGIGSEVSKESLESVIRKFENAG